MFDGIFSWKKKKSTEAVPPQSQEPKETTKEATTGQIQNYPWNGQPDVVPCNFALGSFMHNFRSRLTVDGRVHAETYLAAIGVIAGFAAQRSLFARLAAETDGATLEQLQVATIKDEKFFFGTPINNMLIPSEHVSIDERLWSLAGRGAVTAGLALENLPNLNDMFNHVTKGLGGEAEGMPSVPAENHPQLPPKQLLQLLWPFAMMCFTGDAPESVIASKRFWPAQLGSPTTRFWPAITGYVAANVIHEVKDVLDPLKALTIVMESAIYGSKLDPKVVAATQPSE